MRALLFHNVIADVVDACDRACDRMTAHRFARLIADLQTRYDIVPFEPGTWSAADHGTKRTLLLTFDDGFAGVSDVAFPILRDLGCTATVFVMTGPDGPIAPAHLLHFEHLEIAVRLTAAAAIDVRRASLGVLPLASTADRVAALKMVKQWLKHLPRVDRLAECARVLTDLGVDGTRVVEFADARPGRYRKLSRTQIETLRAHGWTIGGHTRSHPSLAHVEAASLREEILGNASDLGALGLAGGPFAYPYGGPDHVSEAAEAAIRDAGFSCAFTTVAGDNDARTNPFQLYRFSVPALQREELLGLGAVASKIGHARALD